MLVKYKTDIILISSKISTVVLVMIKLNNCSLGIKQQLLAQSWLKYSLFDIEQQTINVSILLVNCSSGLRLSLTFEVFSAQDCTN